MQVRDWLYVDDHCRGILAVLEKGRDGEIYNIGGNRSLPNLEVVRKVLALTGKPESLIQLCDGPAGPRPPLRAFQRKTHARNRLAAASLDFEDGPGAHHRVVPRATRPGWRACAAANIGPTTSGTTGTVDTASSAAALDARGH